MAAINSLEATINERIKENLIPNHKNFAINLFTNLQRSDLFVECFKNNGIPICDIYKVAIANHAAQFKSNADYIAVVDTTQKQFVSNNWDINENKIIVSGYLGAKEKLLPNTTDKEATSEQKLKNILIATQADVFSFNVKMIQCLSNALKNAEINSIGIRLHPRESIENYERYKKILTDNNIKPIHISHENKELAQTLNHYGILITQTSNVALEAAISGCLVVKYLAQQKFVNDIVNNTPYSLNIYEDQEFSSAIQSILFDKIAQTKLKQKANKYIFENPNLTSHEEYQRFLITFLLKRRKRSFRKINLTLLHRAELL